MIFLIALGIFLCKDRLLPGKCRSKLLNNNNNPNKSYEPMKGRRLSMSTSTGGVDDQDNRMLQLVLLSFSSMYHIDLCFL
jgi:hypothetical protein